LKRFLIAFFAALALPSSAGDLGPADLTQEQMSAAFPTVGTVWEAWCGQMPIQEKCTVTLEENELVVNDKYKIPYANLIKSEYFDSMWSITRLGKADPVYAQWEGYLKRKGMAHTVLIEYLSSENKSQLAIFGFSNATDYYGLGNAMKMIIYGAKPKLP